MIKDLFFIVIILLLGVNTYSNLNYLNSDNHNNFSNNNSPNNNSPNNNISNNEIYLDSFLKKRDELVVENPLIAPEQRVEKRQYPKMMINEHTRGEPDDYQLMGVLYNNTINKTYQLFGRRTYPGSSTFEYYYRGKDVGGLDYKFPLPNKEEIYDNVQVYVPTDENIFTAKIYNFDRPRYIPYI
jgi:hypothetical protein